MGIKNGIKTALVLCALSLSCNFANATKLPDNIWNYVKSELPKATQRFDSVILLDGVNMYVPLYPPISKNVEKLYIKYTYPANKTLKNRPEVVVFNNDLVLMKIFRDSKGNYTLTQNNNLPPEVKSGIMPQDMIVPAGLKVPENLRIIMGNLVIPQKGDNLVITPSDSILGKDESSSEGNLVPMVELKDTKAFFTSNKSKFVLVYDKGGTKPLYEIKLSGLPNKIIASPRSKYALTLYFGSKTAEIVDLVNERVLTKIDFENTPSDADLDLTNQIAYVTSAKANSIYMVDLNSATLVKTIKTDRTPDKISVAAENKLLVFNDKNNENIYLMDLETFAIKKIDTIPNLSTLLIKNNKIIATSRTQNKAYIYNINNFESEVPAELAQELRLNEKPTDAVIYNDKLFILCSKDGVIDVYDLNQNKMLEPIDLDKTGFYSKITPVPNQTNAIVTGLNTKKIIIINLESGKLTKKVTGDINVNDLSIIDNKPPVVINQDEEEL